MENLRIIAAPSFTRPSDTTNYTAGDVVSTIGGTILIFDEAARENGGSGLIRSVLLKKSKTVTANGNFRLHLFTATQTAIADNSPWELPAAHLDEHIGYIDLTATNEGGGNDTATAIAQCALPFVCASGTKRLFGVLVATGVYNPYSAETFTVKLGIE